tara:strand:- start:743 stop:919 length:177 start_codon:yes stop_codon:yes gene_type:complete
MKTIQNLIVILWGCYILQAVYFFTVAKTPILISLMYLTICTLVCGMLLNMSGYKGGIK